MLATLRRNVHPLVVLLATVVALAAITSSPAEADEVSKLEARIGELEGQLKTARAAYENAGALVGGQEDVLAEVAGRLAAAARTLTALEGELAQAGHAHAHAAQRLGEAQTRLDGAAAFLEIKQQALANEEQVFHGQLTQAYMYGETRDTMMIAAALDGGTLQDVTRNLAYVEGVLDHERVVVAQVASARDEAAGAKRDVAWERLRKDLDERLAQAAVDKQRELAEAQRQVTAQIDADRARQQRLLDTLSSDAQSALGTVRRIERDIKDTKAKLEAAKLAKDGARVGSNGMVCPLPPSKASFINDWHFPRSGGRLHKGIDMFAPYGTPIYAPWSGTIRYNTDIDRRQTIGGRSISMFADNGAYVYMTHNSWNDPNLRAGSRIRAGQVIARVGTSGNAAGTPPHVHLQIHPSGRTSSAYATPPYPYMVAACR